MGKMPEKIDLDKGRRLESINKLSLILQDTKLKSLREIRKIAETIEILSNDSILKGLNNSLDDIKKGRFVVVK